MAADFSTNYSYELYTAQKRDKSTRKIHVFAILVPVLTTLGMLGLKALDLFCSFFKSFVRDFVR